MKEAFDQPFRHSGTNTLHSTLASSKQSTQSAFASGSHGPGKNPETECLFLLTQHVVATTAPDSPPWDIETDSAPSAPASNSVREQRPASPIWSIELDLNASDEESATGEPFGNASLL